jgi:chromosome partitioning protein
MGVSDPDALPVTITTVIKNIIDKKEIDPTAGIIHHKEGVDLMPTNINLTGIELILAPLMGREVILRKYLNKVKHLYDYCLIDTSPTLDILTINALAAADSVIIPVTPKFLDAKGLELLLRSIAGIREDINPNLDICGILMSMVDNRTNLSKEIIGVIEQTYGKSIRIFKDHIPNSIRAAESSAKGISIFQHDPTGKLAAAYESLVQELLSGRCV